MLRASEEGDRTVLDAGKGLTRVSTEQLKRALKSVYRKDVSCPLSIEDLTRVGLQNVASELLRSLRGLDETAVQAILVTVIAERSAIRSSGPS